MTLVGLPSPAKSAPAIRPFTTELHPRPSTVVNVPNMLQELVRRGSSLSAKLALEGKQGGGGTQIENHFLSRNPFVITPRFATRCLTFVPRKTRAVLLAADMLQALGRRASRHGYRCLASPAASRCASYEAMVHRRLTSAAGSTGTWKADPAASPAKGDPAAIEITAAAGEAGSTSAEMDRGGDPNHILLYTGSKVLRVLLVLSIFLLMKCTGFG